MLLQTTSCPSGSSHLCCRSAQRLGDLDDGSCLSAGSILQYLRLPPAHPLIYRRAAPVADARRRPIRPPAASAPHAGRTALAPLRLIEARGKVEMGGDDLSSSSALAPPPAPSEQPGESVSARAGRGDCLAARPLAGLSARSAFSPPLLPTPLPSPTTPAAEWAG